MDAGEVAMPRIIFVEADGTEHVAEAVIGGSVMQAARNNDVPGIIADCGGACACATCHVYVRHEWLSKAGVPDGMESDMLEAAEDVRSTSRLSCQIRVTADLDGLIVDIPAAQRFA